MPNDLRNKVLVVTGASSGIGAATAVAAAREGMDVVINARRLDKLAKVAEIVEQAGRGAEIVVGDVVEPGMSRRLLDAATARFGRFDVVFANAGFGVDQSWHEMRDEDLRGIFETNFFAAAGLLREAATRLIAGERQGHLLMCSSCLAKFTIPFHGAYSATKAAQAHLARTMRYELRHRGIEVSSVHPITTTTEFFEVASAKAGRHGERTGLDKTPSFFIQTPDQVARAIIKCLKRPRSEVWTSLAVRLAAGVVTAFPGLIDPFMWREARDRAGTDDGAETTRV
ncbi:MAG: SDR family NAD(P)-dependent oxidoreductase [Phycisphaerales bacterium]|jgi:short-subunit dehydrogenase